MSYRVFGSNFTIPAADLPTVITVTPSTENGLTGFCLQGANISSGANILTISTSRSLATFAVGDVGKAIQITGAGTSGADLYTTISGFTNSTTVTTTANAATTVTNNSAFWYPVGQNDTATLQAAIDACTNTVSTVYLTAGVYVIASTLTNSANFKRLVGEGLNQTYIIPTSASFTGDMLALSSIPRGIEVSNLTFKHTGLAKASCSAPITAWSITSNVATFTATNSYSAGQVVALSGFTSGGNIFNDSFLTILSSGLSGSQFKANFTHADGSGSDTGVAHLDYKCL
jgi:hypothetical protein